MRRQPPAARRRRRRARLRRTGETADGYFSSRAYSSRSPGWHFSSRHNASSVEKRMAFALFVLRIDRLTMVTSTRSASSVRVMLRSSNTRSRLTRMPIASDRERLLFVEPRAGAEDFGNHEDEQAEDDGPHIWLREDVERHAGNRQRRARVDVLGPDDDRARDLGADHGEADEAYARGVGGDEW